MPIYDYRCEACGHEFELLVFASSPPPSCASCASQKVTRLPSLFGIRSGGKTTPAGGASCGSCRAASCAGCGVKAG